ncbi:MAG: hypothetical protein OEL55_02970, partial [Desulfobulbaceae bacterium]|nr:hypothetical protein [Desulfobulbaceae bacterium]
VEQEFIAKNLTDYLCYDTNNVFVGIRGHSCGFDVCQNAPDSITPFIALLRLCDKAYAQLNAIAFTNASVVLAAPNGTLYAELANNPTALAIYETYYPPHKAFLTTEGVETDTDTGIVNPRTGELYIFTDWAR